MPTGPSPAAAAAAIAAAHVSPAAVVRYAGVGNISAYVVSPETSRGLMSQNGTAGLQMRKVQQFDYPWPERGLLVMHSDGLRNRWALDAYHGLTTAPSRRRRRRAVPGLSARP